MERAELHLYTKLSDDISVITPKEAMEYAIAHTILSDGEVNIDTRIFPIYNTYVHIYIIFPLCRFYWQIRKKNKNERRKS